MLRKKLEEKKKEVEILRTISKILSFVRERRVLEKRNVKKYDVFVWIDK